MKKPTNFTLSLVDPIAANLVLKHERNFPANARDEILARTEDNHDFDFIADPRDLVSRIFRRNGRVGTYYGESWDEILAYNAKQVAAGTPANCVAFEDSAGTIPLVAPLGSGKGCGLLLDRSKGLVRGVDIFKMKSPAAYFSFGSANAAWISDTGVKSLDFVAVSPNSLYEVTPIGGSADRLRVQFEISGSTYVSDAEQSPDIFVWSTGRIIRTPANATKMRLYFGSNFATVTGLTVKEIPGNHRIQTSATARGEMSRRVNLLTGTETLATQSITTIAASSVLSFSGAGSITLSGTATGTYAAGTHAITTTVGTLTLTVSGAVTQADFRYSADAGIGKTYQRVTSASDYDEEGFPAYLRRQTDDWSKAHINPNGATKVFVLTAVQPLNMTASAILLESSANGNSNNGTIALLAPNSPDAITFRSKGVEIPVLSTYFGAPAASRYVIAGNGYIPSRFAECVVNGVPGIASTGDSDVGTYTEQDFFFGARAGTVAFVNDREYSPPLILFMQPGDPGISAAEIRNLTKLFSKGIRL